MSSRLAIHGGVPVRSTLLPYGRQSITEEDISAVVEVLRSDWLTTGPKVEEFEKCVADRAGTAHAVCFSSGTAALHAAAVVAGLHPGDEAITSPLTFAATANCIVYAGAIPVFADVCEDTLNLDPGQVERKITRSTRAILAVDYGGHPADLDPLRALADRNGLVLIDDAAHALGARYRGRPIGAIGDMTMFSFHPVKHVTTGEGGVITTHRQDYAQALRVFRNHGLDSDARLRQSRGSWYYEMVTLGYNYRLPDILCALGISQMRRLDAGLRRRKEIAAAYTGAFAALQGICPPRTREESEPAWHLYPIRLDLSRFTVDRAEIFRALRAENIGVNVHYIPVHLHPYYRERFGFRPGQFPVAETAYECLITLPIFSSMTDQDVAGVVEAVRKVQQAFGKE